MKKIALLAVIASAFVAAVGIAETTTTTPATTNTPAVTAEAKARAICEQKKLAGALLEQCVKEELAKLSKAGN